MTTAYERYRKKVSFEQEDAAVDAACKATCLGEKVPALPPCSGQEGALFKANPPWKGAVPQFPDKTTESKYRCWMTMSTLPYGSATIPGFVGDSAAVALLDTECLKCRQRERAKIQIAGAIAPDYRFWIGAGAAGVGVLLAVTMKLIRR